MTDERIYRVAIPPEFELININSTRGGHFRVKGPKVKALRDAGRTAALDGSIPRMNLARIVCHVTRGRLDDRWDPANWYPSAKAVVDGFTDAGLWPDDSIRHVIGPDMRGVFGTKAPPYGCLFFEIHDLSGGE